jgi:hypothetical protein
MTGGGVMPDRGVRESVKIPRLRMREAGLVVEVGVLIVPPRRAVAIVEESHGPAGIAGPA